MYRLAQIQKADVLLTQVRRRFNCRIAGGLGSVGRVRHAVLNVCPDHRSDGDRRWRRQPTRVDAVPYSEDDPRRDQRARTPLPRLRVSSVEDFHDGVRLRRVCVVCGPDPKDWLALRSDLGGVLACRRRRTALAAPEQHHRAETSSAVHEFALHGLTSRSSAPGRFGATECAASPLVLRLRLVSGDERHLPRHERPRGPPLRPPDGPYDALHGQSTQYVTNARFAYSSPTHPLDAVVRSRPRMTRSTVTSAFRVVHGIARPDVARAHDARSCAVERCSSARPPRRTHRSRARRSSPEAPAPTRRAETVVAATSAGIYAARTSP